MKKSIWTRVIPVMMVLMFVLVTACEQPVVDTKPTEPEPKPELECITNIAFIAAVERATDSEGSPVNIGWTKEADGTVKLTQENLKKIRAVTELNISGSFLPDEEKLTDISSIEYFTGLTYLRCDYNQLTELDVSANTALTTLTCYGNQLTALDVSNLTALTTLTCSGNQLTELDVSKNTVLAELNCNDNQLTSLDVSTNTKLKTLNCSANQLTSLDVSTNTSLHTLNCSANQLTSLNIQNTVMNRLFCQGNGLKKMDMTDFSGLADLKCGKQTSINGTGQEFELILTETQYLLWEEKLKWSSDNKNVKVVVSGGLTGPVTGVSLDRVECLLCVDESITLTATVQPVNAANKTVRWSAEPADALTLTDNKDGSCTVTATQNGPVTVTVTTVDGNKTAQCKVNIYGQEVEILTDTAFIAAVEKATADQGNLIPWIKKDDGTVILIEETLEAIQAVTELEMNGSSLPEEQKLTDLSGIKYFTGLMTLTCIYHNLTALDVSKCPNLTVLKCYDNHLMSLDVSANTALKELDCIKNKLDVLDITKLTNLEELSCGGQAPSAGGEITLKLTAEQKAKWDETWGKDDFNTGVKLDMQ